MPKSQHAIATEFAEEFATIRKAIVQNANELRALMNAYGQHDLEARVCESLDYVSSAVAGIERTAQVAAHRFSTAAGCACPSCCTNRAWSSQAGLAALRAGAQ